MNKQLHSRHGNLFVLERARRIDCDDSAGRNRRQAFQGREGVRRRRAVGRDNREKNKKRKKLPHAVHRVAKACCSMNRCQRPTHSIIQLCAAARIEFDAEIVCHHSLLTQKRSAPIDHIVFSCVYFFLFFYFSLVFLSLIIIYWPLPSFRGNLFFCFISEVFCNGAGATSSRCKWGARAIWQRGQ